MKKSTLFTLLFVVGLMSFAQAQNEDYRLNVGLSGNYTLTGFVLNSIIETAEAASDGIDKKSFPSVQLTADYGLTNWFSVGLAASYQKIGFEATGNTFTDENGMTQTENYEYDFTRTSVALRPLFHFANNDRLDMYSGLRIGLFRAESTTTSNDPNFDANNGVEFEDVNTLTVSLVAYGIRYYITENIGIGWELNIGRPYVSNFSVNARF